MVTENYCNKQKQVIQQCKHLESYIERSEIANKRLHIYKQILLISSIISLVVAFRPWFTVPFAHYLLNTVYGSATNDTTSFTLFDIIINFSVLRNVIGIQTGSMIVITIAFFLMILVPALNTMVMMKLLRTNISTKTILNLSKFSNIIGFFILFTLLVFVAGVFAMNWVFYRDTMWSFSTLIAVNAAPWILIICSITTIFVSTISAKHTHMHNKHH